MKKLLFVLLLLGCAFAKAQNDPDYPFAPDAAQNIIAAEYFFDTDPGFGNAVALSVAPGADIANSIKNINTAALGKGVHRLYVRSKSNGGRWSLTGFQMFTVDFDPAYPAAPAAAQNIAAAEYFIDTDPGYGNGTAVNISQGMDINNASFTVNTTGLANGVHRVYFRSKNNSGQWSLVNYKEFVVDINPDYPAAPAAAQNIVAAEYFIDTDPGYGNGTAITVTAGMDINHFSANINATGLINGVHRLYVRTLSNDGRWSLSTVSPFTVDSDPGYPVSPVAAQDITAAEYYVDTDPGFGNATAIGISQGLDVTNIPANIHTSALSIGVHRVYVRTKDNNGRWSLSTVSPFTVNSDPDYAAAPAAAQNITAAEYFIDTDPGFAKGTAITLTPDTDISNVSANINTLGLSNGLHTLFVRSLGQDGSWSLSSSVPFYTDLLGLSADSIHFGNAVTGTAVTRNLIITNNSASGQTINSLSIGAPFSTSVAAPVTIAAGGKDTIALRFAPSATGSFTDSIVLNTGAGHYKTVLDGTGITPVLSWTLTPASVQDYGNVAIGTPATAQFSIKNTGNADIILSNISLTDSAFSVAAANGTIITPNSTYNFVVTFVPAAVHLYSALLTIKSSTSSIRDTTIQITGSGYIPGAPPVLSFVSDASYSGNGVNPAAGPRGNYTYRILYKSPNNLPPQAGYPKVGIDLNGDNDFSDFGEGTFTMVKADTGTNYITGALYTYTYSHDVNTGNAGYRFFANDANGNSGSTTYKSGPVITDQQLDLRIFADDIQFSNNNPDTGETFTMTATVHNSSALPADHVPVRFYRDTVYLGEGVIPHVGPNTTATISRDFSFSAEGFYPVKVWIDSSNILGDISPLNNYAIRPVIVGSPDLPGGITVTTTAVEQQCPNVKVIISGHADYYGTAKPTAVAGGTVTITIPGNTFTTTTNGNGDFSYTDNTTGCGNDYEYNVKVTDYTFTSKPVTNIIPLPCPSDSVCGAQPENKEAEADFPHDECPPKVGDTLAVRWHTKYPQDKPVDALDYIANSVCNYYVNGLPVAQNVHDSEAAPAKETAAPDITYIIKDTAPIVFTTNGTFIYFRHGVDENGDNVYTAKSGSINGSYTYHPEPKLPDLEIVNFQKTGATSFSFEDKNTVCGDGVEAHGHTVSIYDSLPNGFHLLQTQGVSLLEGGQSQTIYYNDITLAPGKHFLKIVTDEHDDVHEAKEDNNVFRTTFTVPRTDLSISSLYLTPSDADSGSQIIVHATIKNSGKTCGAFKVQFALDGVQIGNLVQVAGVAEKSKADVADTFTVAAPVNSCGGWLSVYADVFSEVGEEHTADNKDSIAFSADIKPYQQPNEQGTEGNPVIVRVNTTNQFNPAIRNTGSRDAKNFVVEYSLWKAIVDTALDGTIDTTIKKTVLGTQGIALVKPEPYVTYGSFTWQFTKPGDYIVHVWADTADAVCESDATNNTGAFHIRVTDTKPDFEVLSQYISPGSLNPNAHQSITLVGTVRNSGGKVSQPGVLRFLADDIQIGNDVPIDSIQPGKDTTVAASATYSSGIEGTKIISIIADPNNVVDEEREDNNTATRAIIVGNAPDFAWQHPGAISLNPEGFKAGDNVLVAYAIANKGMADGMGWVRFTIRDAHNSIMKIDSVQFTLAAGANGVVSKTMHFDIDKGYVTAEIYNAGPDEYDLLNNSDTLAFSNIAVLRATTHVNGNLDMEQADAADFPGWTGGCIVLGDYDLIVHGSLLNYDSTHLIVTNGKGRLKLINALAQNTYPVATELGKPNFLTLKNTGTPDNFSVSVLPYVLHDGMAGEAILTGCVNRTWLVEEDVPGGSYVMLTFFWNPENELPGFDRTKARIAHYHNNGWQLGSIDSAAAAYAEYSLSQNGYTAFSPFLITSDSLAVTHSTPLHFLSFAAFEGNNNVLLNWTTNDEVNTASFDIESHNGGNAFEKIGSVAAQNTAGVHAYNYVDNSAAQQTVYYRIRQIDKDGRFSYSEVVSVTRRQVNAVLLYPNPVNNILRLKNVQKEDIAQLQVVSVNGKMVMHINVRDDMQYDVSALAGGVYYLCIINKSGARSVIAFIKR